MRKIKIISLFCALSCWFILGLFSFSSCILSEAKAADKRNTMVSSRKAEILVKKKKINASARRDTVILQEREKLSRKQNGDKERNISQKPHLKSGSRAIVESKKKTVSFSKVRKKTELITKNNTNLHAKKRASFRRLRVHQNLKANSDILLNKMSLGEVKPRKIRPTTKLRNYISDNSDDKRKTKANIIERQKVATLLINPALKARMLQSAGVEKKSEKSIFDVKNNDNSYLSDKYVVKRKKDDVIAALQAQYSRSSIGSNFRNIPLNLPNYSAIMRSKNYAALVVDVNSGKVLYCKNPKSYRYPASLTKLMTLYLIFDALDAKILNLNQRIPVSLEASRQKPSKIYLQPGEEIAVRDAIASIIVKSANDATFAIAEYLGRGNINHFIRLMNEKAIKLGMSDTMFYNPHGLHHAKQITTAHDIAVLGIALQKHHKKYIKLFTMRQFKFKNSVFNTHNRLLFLSERGIKGMKTGFTNASGYNLVTNMEKRGGKNLLGVVLGGQSSHIRDAHMLELLESCYAHNLRR